MQAVSGGIPVNSQEGLKETLIQLGYFLACRCFPENDINVALPAANAVSMSAVVSDKISLGSDVLGLRLIPESGFSCQPGQYLNIVHDDLVRSYSIANLPDKDGYVELHIKRLPDGRMSNWLHGDLKVGDLLEVRGPAGSCFYCPGERRNFPLLLAGTGTGLAPLEAIARDALNQGHEGNIQLVHGALNKTGIYHEAELVELDQQYPQFTYTQSLMDDEDPLKADISAMLTAALEELDLDDVHVYLCGDPALVNTLKTSVFLKGVASDHIFSDPFITVSSP